MKIRSFSNKTSEFIHIDKIKNFHIGEEQEEILYS